MTCSRVAICLRMSLVCAVVSACVGIASSSVPISQQRSSSLSDNVVATGGFSNALWTVLDDCFRADSVEPAAVCLKSKVLIALDRVLARPTVNVVDGVSLTARNRKYLVDPLPADRAALKAAVDPNERSALLDSMLANRMDEFMSTRTVELMNDSAEQEGRGKSKKKLKVFKKAAAIAGMIIFFTVGSVIFKSIALMALTSLLASKFSLALYTVLTLGKTLQDHSNSHPSKSTPQYFDRVMQINDHDTMAAAARRTDLLQE